MKAIIIGGVPRSLTNFRGPLIETMVARGHEVIACAPNAPVEVRQALSGVGVKYCHVPIERAGVNPLHDIKTAFSLFRLFNRRIPDVVLGYTVKPVIWGSLAARVAGVPATYAMITGLGYSFIKGGNTKQRAVGRLVKYLYRAALSRTQGVFFQNPDDLNEFWVKKILPKNARAILINGSGVDLNFYYQTPLPEKPVFLLMARLIGDKGIREYVEAGRRVRNIYPNARFLLAGGFDENPAAISKKEVHKWQENGDVVYLGKLEDVRPAIAQSRIYVLPSYREGTPRTVLEAMSSGRPIITTNAPGCRETVQDGVNGFLVPVKNVDALAEAMQKFIRQPKLAERMGKESRRVAEIKYDVHKVNRVILEAMGL